MVERRNIEKLLPTVHQTDSLTKFFNSTVNQLFQPGKLEKISGFIGQKPKYFNINKDFYVEEPTLGRSFYSLEPVMVSINKNSNQVNNKLFYPDLVNQLRFQGGIVINQHRLSEQIYYSWSPAIDLDKILNFTNYFWLKNGPDSIDITDSTDISNDILGKKSFTTSSGLIFSSGMRVTFKNDANILNNDKIFIIEGVGQGIILIEDEILECLWDVFAWDDCLWDDTNPYSNPDYIVMARGSNDENAWSKGNRWFHKDVISSSELSLDINLQAKRPIIEYLRDLELYNFGTLRRPNVDLLDLVHTNIFSEVNGSIDEAWDIFSWDSQLWDNGPLDLEIDGVQVRDGLHVLFISDTNSSINNRVYTITGISDTNILTLVLNKDGSNPSGAPVLNEQILVNFGLVNFGKELTYNGTSWVFSQLKISLNQDPLFTLYDIDSVRLDDTTTYPNNNFSGGKLFSFKIDNSPTGIADTILNKNIAVDSLGEIIFENNLVTDRFTFNNGRNDIIGFYFHHRNAFNFQIDSFSNDWFPVSRLSKQYIDDEFFISSLLENKFDISQNPDMPLKPLDELPNLIVELDGVELEETIDFILEETMTGNGDFRRINISTTLIKENSRLLVKSFSEAGPTKETLIGFSEIPLNLQANPNNSEFESGSISDFSKHFSDIIKHQDGIIGESTGSNNWRDTPQLRNLGLSILQHSAPLLKTMLLSSDENLDIMKASRFVEREYARFQNKFFRKITEFSKSADFDIARFPSATPSFWVDNALSMINLSKTSDFPFYNSQMGGTNTYIPSTPSRLGVYPVYTPSKFIDDTFITPTEVIMGHDGSIYIAAGNEKDDAILELENRIFSNIPSNYKTENLPIINHILNVDGRFRLSEYRIEEFNKLLSYSFNRWAIKNNVDYRKNTTFVPLNKFTWNFTGSLDFEQKPVTGSWKAIYRFFFDTIRPHTSPWEMLGFSIKPSWWDGRYGVAPYTKGNTLLWNDLEQGFIFSGNRVGIDTRFARPGLKNIIPVNDNGDLLDPIEAGIIPQTPSGIDGKKEWSFGEEGPIETVWKRTSNYPFAVAQATYLMEPVKFIELGWDPINYKTILKGDPINSQIIFIPTKNRPTHDKFIVHGEKDSNDIIQISSGISQWISDFITYQGKDIASNFGDKVRGLNVKLGHKSSGFIDANNTKILSENFGLVPQENITISLYTSPSIKEEFYSGVLIEWEGTGWRVIGYDQLSPIFNIIPSDEKGRKNKITVGDESVILFKNGVNPKNIQQISYGHIFSSRQLVFDFLISYQRYLESIGWLFDEIDFQNNSFFNFEQSGKEFLLWSQSNWDKGNFISVSPIARKVKFTNKQGIVNPVEKIINGVYSILDKEGKLIDPKNTEVSRINDILEIIPKTNDQSIFSARVSISEIEHIILFDNITLFNDVVYDPLFNIRQPRLKIFSIRTTDWAGRLDAPGCIISDGSLFSNYERVTHDFKNFFDIENSIDDTILRKHSQHLIGFQGRDYLEKLLFNNTTQFQFWQGMMKEKGTSAVLNRMFRSEFITETTNFKTFEEWAFRIGEFGGVDSNKFLEIIFKQSEIKTNPQLIEFFEFSKNLKDNKFDEIINIEKNDNRWITKPNDLNNIFPLSNIGEPKIENLLSAGYVKLGEPDLIVVDNNSFFSAFSDNLIANTPLSIGNIIWVLNTGIGDWGIFRLSDFNITIDEVSPNLGNSKAAIVSTTSNINTVISNLDTIILSNVLQVSPIIDGTYLANTTPIITGILLSAGTVSPIPIVTILSNAQVTIDKITITVTRAFDGPLTSISFGDLANTTRVLATPSGTLQTEATTVFSTSFLYSLNTEFQIFLDTTDSTEGQATVDIEYSYISGFELLDKDQVGVEVDTKGFGGDIFHWTNIRVNTLIERDNFITTDLQKGDLIFVDSSVYQINTRGTINTPDINPVIDVKVFDNKTKTSSSIGTITIDESMPPLNNSGTINVGDLASIINFSNIANVIASVNSDDVLIISHLKGELLFFEDITGNIAESFKLNKINLEKQWAVYSWNTISWDLVRNLQQKVDTSKILGGILTNKSSNKIEEFITIWDPAKGIIPGAAEKELTLKLESDIAIYTNGDPLISTIDNNNHWGEEQVGYLWWDISTAKYLNYELDDNLYKRNHWGELAPGASIDIFEWVKSPVSPDSWEDLVISNAGQISINKLDIPSGEVKGDPATAPFVLSEEFDKNLGDFISVYYFWVKNKTTIPTKSTRTLSAKSVSNIIKNPTNSGISWLSPISNNSLIISGNFPNLTDNDSILRINWKELDNDINFHKQWVLHRPGDGTSIPNSKLWNKMRDSISGIDNLSRIVPDVNLPILQQIGNFERPRQSWIMNILKARESFFTCVNDMLSKVCLLDDRAGATDGISFIQVEPSDSTVDFHVVDIAARDNLSLTNTLIQGNTVLVDPNLDTFNKWTIWKYNINFENNWEPIQAQATDLTDFWALVDWFADGFDSNTPIDFQFATISDRDAAAPFAENSIIKVDDGGLGKYTIYQVVNGIFVKIGRELCTVKFNDTSYKSTEGFGWDENTWDSFMWDPLPTSEIFTIIEELKNNILIPLEINELFFCVINYVHSEQNIVDWAFKTSLITLSGFDEKLIQTPVFSPNRLKIDPILDYIAEVKPYHVKLRTFIRNLFNDIEMASAKVTDFDNPVYFDTVLGMFRTLDPNDPTDQNILANNLPWSDWFDNFSTNPSVIRQIKIKILMDRIDCEQPSGWDEFKWDTIGWESIPTIDGAGGRILKYYSPSDIMPEKNVNNLLSGCIYSGVNYESLDLSSNSELDVDIFGGNVKDNVVLIFTGNGSTSIFTIPINVTSSSNVIVKVDDILQIEGISNNYTLDSTNTIITFTAGSIPLTGSIVEITITQTFLSVPEGPSTINVDGDFFMQPLVSENSPKELLKLDSFDSVVISTYTKGIAGSPIVTSNRIIANSSSLAGPYNILQFPSTIDSIQVHINGTLQKFFGNGDVNNDYNIDFSLRQLTFTSGNEPTASDVIKITSFSVGGGEDTASNSRILFQNYFVGDGSTTTFTLDSSSTAARTFVTVDGDIATFTISGSSLTITSGTPSNGSNINVTVFDVNTVSFTTIKTLPFTVGSSSELTGNILTLPNSLIPPSAVPKHSAMFIHKSNAADAGDNAFLLNPPETTYFDSDGIQQNIILNSVPVDTANLILFNDNVQLTLNTDYIVIEETINSIILPSVDVLLPFNSINIKITIGSDPVTSFQILDLDGDSKIDLNDFINSINNNSILNLKKLIAIRNSDESVKIVSNNGDSFIIADDISDIINTFFGSSSITSNLTSTVHLTFMPNVKSTIVAILNENFDYKISIDGVTVTFDPTNVPLVANDILWVTSIINSKTLKPRTETFKGNTLGKYTLTQTPFNPNDLWVTVNHNKKLFLHDYNLDSTLEGWDTFPWDTGSVNSVVTIESRGDINNPTTAINSSIIFDINGVINAATIILIETSTIDGVVDLLDIESIINNDNILAPLGITATIRTTNFGSVLINKLIITCASSLPFSIHNGVGTPVNDIFGVDIATSLSSEWDSSAIFNFIQFPKSHSSSDNIVITSYSGISELPPIAFKLLKNSFNEKESIRISDKHKTFLLQDYKVGDTQIVVKTNSNIPTAELPLNIFTIPDKLQKKPGAVYIEDDRIEFWDISGPTVDGSNNITYTLSTLNRGTGITNSGISAFYSTIIYSGDGATDIFALPSVLSFKLITVTFIDTIKNTKIEQLTGFNILPPNIKFDTAPDNNIFIRITLFHNDWLDGSILHKAGTEVINADLEQQIPGGYNFTPSPEGLQKSKSTLGQFLISSKGTKV